MRNRGREVARAVLIIVLGLVVGVTAAPAYASAKSRAAPPLRVETRTSPSYDSNYLTEHIETYDVKMQVRRDGSMHVTEAIKYDFGDGPYPDLMPGEHHGIVRRISTHRQVDGRHDRVIQVRDPQVHGDGVDPASIEVSHSGGDVVLKIGDPGTTVSGVKTYVIDYDVPRALAPRNGGVDELYWDAVGTRWKVPISKATVTITAPVNIASAGCYRGVEDNTSSCSGSTTAGTTFTAGERHLGPGEGVTLQVELPQAGMASVTPPALVRRPAAFTFSMIAGVLVLLAVGVVAGFAWMCMARPVRRARGAAAPVDSPPHGMGPGLAGVLRNDGDARARQVSAVLVDLATRGYLRFEETKVSKKETGRRLVRGERSAEDLESYEAKVIEVAIGSEGSYARQDEISVATLRKRGWDRWKAVCDLLEQEACGRGWFRWRRRVQRAFAAWLAVGLGVVGAGFLIVVSAGGEVGGVPTAGFGWVVVAFFAAAVAVGVLGRWPARTAAGATAMAEVNAYADVLRDWSRRPCDPEADVAMVSTVFPYAVAFGQANGFASDWGKVFERLADELPWYVPADGSGGTEAARRIKALADIIEDPQPPGPAAARPAGRSGLTSRPRRSGSYDYYSTYTTYDSGSWASSSSSGGWSSGGDSGGGSVGGGDGGGGGGSW